MALKGQSLLFLCRNCRSQLKKSRIETRTFTSTPQRSRVIPSFTPTSSPELDEIFLTFREKVFAPQALAQHHRDLIYKQSRHQILLNDPGVTVTLSNDEEIRLMPMNQRDRPNKQKSLKRIAQLLAESDDLERWGNLPAFLEGMKMSHYTIPDAWLEGITRKANEVGKTGVIKLCADMVKKTGITLSNPALTKELMLGYHLDAAKAGFQGHELQDLLRKVERIAIMMENELHCGGKLKEGQVDMRRDVTVLGVLLELSAAKAMSVDKGKDRHGKVANYVVKLLACGKNEAFELATDPDDIGRELVTRIPLWNGMKMALKVDGIAEGANGSDLRKMKEKLDQVVQKTRAIVEKDAEGKPRRCLNMLAEIEA